MCWRISFNKNPDDYRKIADKDITVYKIGYMTAECNFSGPLYKNFIYKPNVLNVGVKLSVEDKQILSFDKIHYEYQINEGYHSYSDECYIKEGYIKGSIIIIPSGRFLYHLGYYRNALYYRNTFIGKFIIPKGTEYYTNEDGEIVSSNIIWTGEYYKTKDIKEPFINFKKLDYVLVGDKKEDI